MHERKMYCIVTVSTIISLKICIDSVVRTLFTSEHDAYMYGVYDGYLSRVPKDHVPPRGATMDVYRCDAIHSDIKGYVDGGVC